MRTIEQRAKSYARTMKFHYQMNDFNCRYYGLRLDKRTKWGKLVTKFFKEDKFNLTQEEYNTILAKRKARREYKNWKRDRVVSIFDEPLYKDWKANKYHIVVECNRLKDGIRNHWAKNQHDRKILEILKKYSK